MSRSSSSEIPTATPAQAIPVPVADAAHGVAVVIADEHADVSPAETKPRTISVLGLLAMTSLTISYLGSYAVSGAMVQVEMLRPWSADADPRPRWLLTAFCVLMLAFMCVAAAARHVSRRQLKHIDDMGQESAEDAAAPTPVNSVRSLRDSLAP
jgi:hypothetical protein